MSEAAYVLSHHYENCAWGEYQRAVAAGEVELANDILKFFYTRVEIARSTLGLNWANNAPPRLRR